MSETIHHSPADYADSYEADRLRDRVNWPAVFAGIFGTVSLLAVLTVLGLAVGMSAVDRDSDVRNFGLGAGVWGAISALLSFAFGGWLAVRLTDYRARGNGLLQGAMVWMVMLGLLTYVVGSGVGAMATATGQGAAANPDITNRQNIDGGVRTNDANATAPKDRANSVDIAATADRADVERAADRGAKGAWSTLITMLLALGASLGGGYLGARAQDDPTLGRRTAYPARSVTTG